jgi:S1-C subfamily serine protease
MAFLSGSQPSPVTVPLHKSYVAATSLLLMVGAALLLSSEGNLRAQSEYAGRGGWGAANSVYRLGCPDQNRSGTAFGHSSGRIITAEHVVRNCDVKKLLVIAPSGATTGVTAVVGDADFDLALLTPTVADFVKLPLDVTSEEAFTFGAQVSTWGFPEGYKGSVPILSIGQLAGVEELRVKPNLVVRKWVVNGAFNPGNSGGPVIETKTAKVIGVISGKLAPIPEELLSKLQDIEKNGSANEQTIARTLLYMRKQTQLVIGFATLSKDFRDFLKSKGIEP